MSLLFHDAGPNGLDGQRVCLATTSYADPDSSYTFSMAQSREALHKAGISTEYMLLVGNCHVDDARNSIVASFLETGCTDLVFIDADVSWKPSDLVKLCEYENTDIVGGVYPFRRDDAEARLKLPVRMIEGVTEPDERGLIDVAGLPSGFMRIGRHVIEALAKDAVTFTTTLAPDKVQPILFERIIFEGERLGGDLAFCQKWRSTGGKCQAVFEMRLGHAGKQVIVDSMGATMRRQNGTALKHMVTEIQAGRACPDLFTEARKAVGNEAWTAHEDVLSLCALVKPEGDGPIIEMGSGLTTIVLCAANPDRDVWVIEHDRRWANHVIQMTLEAELRNVVVCVQPMKDGWYDLSDLAEKWPESFSLALNDGPPFVLSSRMPFFLNIGFEVTGPIIVDDMSDPNYALEVTRWATAAGKKVEFIGDRGALLRSEDVKQERLAS